MRETIISEWALVLGFIFLAVAIAGTYIRSLPFTTAMVYLIAGVLLGPLGAGLVSVDPIRDHLWIERIAQIAICIALFVSGLKLRARIYDRIWLPSLRLSTLTVAVAVFLVTIGGRFLLGLPWGMAVVLGAILAPTDPVLASDVELEHPSNDDRLRFTFTGEAALNDCTAAPFLALGLGLLSNQSGGFEFVHWLLVDLLWATTGGLLLGAVFGFAIGALVVYLRRHKRTAIGFDDFVVLGLIAFSFGCATILNVNGFLAVFSAAVALRQVELRAEWSTKRTQTLPGPDNSGCVPTTEQQHEAAYLADTSLQFSERLGHLGEVAIVVIIGATFSVRFLTLPALAFTAALLLLVRPISVQLGLLGSQATRLERQYLSWFGIRGAASLYYLMLVERSLGKGAMNPILLHVTFFALALSIVAHGLTASPLMKMYSTRYKRLADQA